VKLWVASRAMARLAPSERRGFYENEGQHVGELWADAGKRLQRRPLDRHAAAPMLLQGLGRGDNPTSLRPVPMYTL